MPAILILSLLLLTALKLDERVQLSPFYRAQKSFKLKRFTEAKLTVTGRDHDLLELWESILTGRSVIVSKWIKSQYKSLGLSHLFTPSGFHLSAVLLPFMKIFQSTSSHIFILILSGIGVFMLPGQGALKRMVLVKLGQKISNQKVGFSIALVLDILFGSFTQSPLSFCYSFLFLGIIYSGKKFLFLWFFLGQCLITFFSGSEITPMILFLSPILNIFFAIALPILFLLAIPLWPWQVFAGVKILGLLQYLVEISAKLSSLVPTIEIHSVTLLCLFLIYSRRRKCFLTVLCIFSFSLNQDFTKTPSFGPYEFVPQGTVIRAVTKDYGELVYYTDGKCKREFVRGIWWEKCAPKRKRGKRLARINENKLSPQGKRAYYKSI